MPEPGGGVAGHGPTVRVDLEHQGREILISPKDTVTVFRHEPVHVVIECDSTRPLDPGGIVAASDLQDGDSKATGALIGPFARWRVRVSDALNPGVDLSAVDKITLEMRLSAQSFGMPAAAPTVTRVSPTTGGLEGGNTVTVTGRGSPARPE